MDLQGKKLSDTYKYLLSVGPIDSSTSITLGNGAPIPWSANGIVVTGNTAQTIGGAKTFNGTLTIPSTLNFSSNGSIVKTGNHAVTLTTSSASNITFSSATARTYTIADPGANASFVMTEGAQTINGAKTFNGDTKILADVEVGLNATATNLFGTGASTNKFGDKAITSNAFGNDVTGNSSFNDFGKASRSNNFGENAFINIFGKNNSGYNAFGIGISGSTAYNAFGSGLISGAQNYFGSNSKNHFGKDGENYFYSGLFAGPVTLPATVAYTSAGSIVKSGNHPLGLITTSGTTGTFPTGNINIAALEGQQTFIGEKTFSSGINITKTTDQLVLGGATKLTISSTAPANNRKYTIPDAGKDVSFILSSGTQTIEGTTTFTSTVNASITGNAGSATNAVYVTGDQSINGTKSFTTRPTVNGSGVLLVGESVASATTPYSLIFGTGLKLSNGTTPASWNGNQDKTIEVDTTYIASLTGNQTLNGIKTFSTGQIIESSTNHITLKTGSAGNSIFITVPSISANHTYTIPDIGSSAAFVLTSGSQTIGGLKTFTAGQTIQSTSNQITLKTGSAGNSIAITAPIISGNRTYTMPDVSGNAEFVMTTGFQAIGGVKNFTSRPTVNGASILLAGDTSVFSKVEAPNLVYNTGNQIINGRKQFTNFSIAGPFENDVDADFNGLLSSKGVYCINDGSIRSAVEIPSLDIVYETGATSLTPRIGPTPFFSRQQFDTSGTYMDKDGYLKYATGNQPRFDYAVSKNLYYGSNSLFNFWRYPEFNAGFTEKSIVSAPNEINPLKSQKDVQKYVDITGSGVATQYTIRRDQILYSGIDYTMSVFAKPINNNFIKFLAPNNFILFNLSNNSISGMGNVGILGSGIDNTYGNGWSRLWMSFKYSGLNSSQVTQITSSDITGATSKIVNTTAVDAFYLWGPQLEQNAKPTSYETSFGIPSVQSPGYEGITSKGLLLERRSSNLVLYSNNFTGGQANNSFSNGSIVLTGGPWPDGSGVNYSGAVYVENNTNSIHNVYRHQISGITGGTNYTTSIFLKQPINGRRYVLGIFSGSGIPDTRVSIDLDSGISGGRTTVVPGYTAPSFYTGIKYPNNWYRLVISQTATSTVSEGGNCSFWSTTGFGENTGAIPGLNGPAFQIFGHQTESLSRGIATSYKPTNGITGRLEPDYCRIEGDDFSGFFNERQGTFFLEAEVLENDTANLYGMLAIEGSNRQSGLYSVYWTPPTKKFSIDYDTAPPNYHNSALFQITTGTTSGVKEFFATSSYKENNFAASFYNQSILTDTTGKLGMLPMDKVVFGANGYSAGPSYSNMYLKRFSYWPLQFQNNKLTGLYRY